MQDKNLPEKKNVGVKDVVTQAHEQAERDIESDPDVNLEPHPGDDLDEGELARLEGED